MIATVPVHADDVQAGVPGSAIASIQAAAPVTPTQAPPEAEPESEPGHDGEVLVKARSRAGDPLQDFNIASFNLAQDVDKAVIAPTSKAYRKILPQPVRSGFGNFLNNLREPVVFVNYVLQLKVGKAAETVARFAINTTVGVAGVFDIAKRKPIYLPRRRNSFANTLGFYGVKPGPFFFAPLLGPTTLRDLVGNLVDQVVPVSPIRPFKNGLSTVPIAVLSALDYRSVIDSELERQRATVDPYTAAKQFYLERRQAEIDALRGKGRKAKPPSVMPEPVPAAAQIDPVPVEDAAVTPSGVLGPPA